MELLKREYNIAKGDWNISEITTNTLSGEGITNAGNYIDLETSEIYGGHAKFYSTGKAILRVAPHYINADIASFRAIAGHELIHVGHHYFLPSVNNLYTERVAHRYTISTYANNGMIVQANRAFQTALSHNYIGYYPSNYEPFFMIGR